jgi:hypothetical protein
VLQVRLFIASIFDVCFDSVVLIQAKKQLMNEAMSFANTVMVISMLCFVGNCFVFFFDKWQRAYLYEQEEVKVRGADALELKVPFDEAKLLQGADDI